MAKDTELGIAYARPAALTAITVDGFKSIASEQRIEIRPLTLLAGANNSGKSSVMQPVLLLKQTLEAPHDYGPLKLDGPHVFFTAADQLLTRGKEKEREFRITLETDSLSVSDTFRERPDQRLDLARTTVRIEGEKTDLILEPGMTGSSLKEIEVLSPAKFGFLEELYPNQIDWEIKRSRCFVQVALRIGGVVVGEDPGPLLQFDDLLQHILHLPGLRRSPERAYVVTAVQDTFPGTFDAYVASVILAWQKAKDSKIQAVGEALERLGLTWKVEARQIDATRIELMVARLPKAKRGSAGDLVNIADVGFGVSQILPVIVALLVAEPGQLVYVEQPELHLHPRAQKELASLLMDAANRGVRVVVETHSSLLLIALQTLIAEKKLDPEKVILHWFQRKPDGSTKVDSVQPDEQGAYGDWPTDFEDVRAESINQYLDAVEKLD